jgi:hypothetical protein
MTATHKNRINFTAFSVDAFGDPHIFQKSRSHHTVIWRFVLGARELIRISVW